MLKGQSPYLIAHMLVLLFLLSSLFRKLSNHQDPGNFVRPVYRRYNIPLLLKTVEIGTRDHLLVLHLTGNMGMPPKLFKPPLHKA